MGKECFGGLEVWKKEGKSVEGYLWDAPETWDWVGSWEMVVTLPNTPSKTEYGA